MGRESVTREGYRAPAMAGFRDPAPEPTSCFATSMMSFDTPAFGSAVTNGAPWLLAGPTTGPSDRILYSGSRPSAWRRSEGSMPADASARFTRYWTLLGG